MIWQYKENQDEDDNDNNDDDDDSDDNDGIGFQDIALSDGAIDVLDFTLNQIFSRNFIVRYFYSLQQHFVVNINWK